MRLHEMAIVPQSIVPLIPALSSARPAPTAAQIYAAVVNLSEADLLKILRAAEVCLLMHRHYVHNYIYF